MSYVVQLKARDGTFVVYRSGYATLKKAKVASARIGRHGCKDKTVRIVCEGDGTVLEAVFRLLTRARWVGVDPKP